jgi:hypothetical protein
MATVATQKKRMSAQLNMCMLAKGGDGGRVCTVGRAPD